MRGAVGTLGVVGATVVEEDGVGIEEGVGMLLGGGTSATGLAGGPRLAHVDAGWVGGARGTESGNLGAVGGRGADDWMGCCGVSRSIVGYAGPVGVWGGGPAYDD